MSGKSSTQFSSESERLRVLHEYDILDTPEEQEFDNLVKLAAHICEVPFAQINFLEDKRQWTKAWVGVDIKEMPREEGFCHHTLKQDEFMIIENLPEDDRFKEMVFVKDDPRVRFYAGFNIKGINGHKLGTLCVIGTEPRKLTEAQHSALDTLAREVEARLELRKRNKELETIGAFLESSVDFAMIVKPADLSVLRFSDKASGLFGLEKEENHHKKLDELIPDAEFISELRNWERTGASGKHQTLAAFELDEGISMHLEVDIMKQHGRWLISARNVSERKENEQKLESLVEEKNLLLAEINHRVKNNLAVISSFLQLEELKSISEEAREVLLRNFMRVKTMAIVHDEIYRVDDLASVDFGDYLNKLVDATLKEITKNEENIEIRTDIIPLRLNVNQAVPSALIVNELIHNARKFAFNGREHGTIVIRIREISGENEVTIQVSDNGIGLPENFALETSPTLGNTLVNSYSEQLNADVTISSDQNGTTFDIRFRKRDNIAGISSSFN